MKSLSLESGERGHWNQRPCFENTYSKTCRSSYQNCCYDQSPRFLALPLGSLSAGTFEKLTFGRLFVSPVLPACSHILRFFLS